MTASKTLSAWLGWLADKVVPSRVESLDDLIAAVVGGFSRARADVHRRAMGTVEALVPDGAAAPSVTLGGADDRFAVPLAGLAKIHIQSLAELSLEFDCVVETLQWNGRESLGLRMVPEGTRGASRLKIDVCAEERIVAAVTLNGELLRAHELEFLAENL